MIKLELTDRSIEMLEDGTILVEYNGDYYKEQKVKLEEDNYMIPESSEFFYADIDDLKRDRDMFNLFLEECGY